MSFVRSVLVSSLLLSAAVFAQDTTARAREAFVKGQELYAAGKYKEALAKFEASYSLKPHPATVFNIARCQDQLGDAVHGMTSYKEYLRQSPQAKDLDEVLKAITAMEQRLQAKGLQHVLVYADPPSAKVFIDQKELGSSPAAATIPPGTHTLTVTASGFETYERQFAMSVARSMEFSVSLSTATPEVAKPTLTPKEPVDSARPTTAVEQTVTPAPRKRVFTWVAAGVAGVGLGLGAVFTVLRGSASATLLDPMQAPMRTRMQADQLVGAVQTNGTLATVSFITAGVAAIAALVLFFVEGS